MSNLAAVRHRQISRYEGIYVYTYNANPFDAVYESNQLVNYISNYMFANTLLNFGIQKDAAESLGAMLC